MTTDRLSAAWPDPGPPAAAAPPSAPLPCPAGFMLWPVACTPLQQALWQLELYRRAFEEAQAVVRPSLPERDLLATWN